MQGGGPQHPRIKTQFRGVFRLDIQITDFGRHQLGEMPVIARESAVDGEPEPEERQPRQRRQTDSFAAFGQEIQQQRRREKHQQHWRQDHAVRPMVRHQHRGQDQRRVEQQQKMKTTFTGAAVRKRMECFQQHPHREHKLGDVPERHRGERRNDECRSVNRLWPPQIPRRTGERRYQERQCHDFAQQVLPGPPRHRRRSHRVKQCPEHRPSTRNTQAQQPQQDEPGGQADPQSRLKADESGIGNILQSGQGVFQFQSPAEERFKSDRHLLGQLDMFHFGEAGIVFGQASFVGHGQHIGVHD